jgi:hypothetical protein
LLLDKISERSERGYNTVFLKQHTEKIKITEKLKNIGAFGGNA